MPRSGSVFEGMRSTSFGKSSPIGLATDGKRPVWSFREVRERLGFSSRPRPVRRSPGFWVPSPDECRDKNKRQALRAMSESLRIRPAWGSGSGLCWEATRRGIPKPSLTRWGRWAWTNTMFDPSPSAVTHKVSLEGWGLLLPGVPPSLEAKHPAPFPVRGKSQRRCHASKNPGALGAESPKT
jgi:hypothetical protein